MRGSNPCLLFEATALMDSLHTAEFLGFGKLQQKNFPLMYEKQKA